MVHGKKAIHYPSKYVQRGGMGLLMLIARMVRLATSSTLRIKTVISKGKLRLLMFGCCK